MDLPWYSELWASLGVPEGMPLSLVTFNEHPPVRLLGNPGFTAHPTREARGAPQDCAKSLSLPRLLSGLFFKFPSAQHKQETYSKSPGGANSMLGSPGRGPENGGRAGRETVHFPGEPRFFFQ